MNKKRGKENGVELGGGLEGIMQGLTDFVGKLGELAEKGESLSQTREFQWKDKNNNPAKGVFGFSVKMGLSGENEVKIEPFGNIYKDKKTGESVVREIREPIVDMFEEKDFILVVAEMPGIDAKNVQFDLKDDILLISAEKGDKKYRKEVLLPGNFSREKMTVSGKNGIVEIKCNR